MTAATAVPGMPSVSAGINADAVSALFATSAAATPSGSPSPQTSGFVELRRASLYDMNAAIDPPAPGKIPIQMPMADPRNQVFQYPFIRGSAFQIDSVPSLELSTPVLSGVSNRSITGGSA